MTIVDNDDAVTRRASEQHGLVALSGDATMASVLEEADVRQSDVVVAMLRRDADNLAVALLARAAGVHRVMVRMRDNAYRPPRESSLVHAGTTVLVVSRADDVARAVKTLTDRSDS